MVEEAQAQRAPAESIVDRFARRYTPVVVALAAAVAFVPPSVRRLVRHLVLPRTGAADHQLPLRASVISTPVSILAALARATQRGVLIKGGAYLEQMAGLKAVAFDKTGTLTLGRPQVTDVVPLNGGSPEQRAGAGRRRRALQRAPARAGHRGRARHAGRARTMSCSG